MKLVVIGGSGHIGSYLLPRLVEAGHQVVNVSRSRHTPYHQHTAWSNVTQITLDRSVAEANSEFGSQIAALEPHVVIDLICFTLSSAKQIVSALKGWVTHFLSCGTIWVHGPSVMVPTTEDQPRRPFGDYGIQKAAIEEYLLTEAKLNNFPATVLHPGHIVGPGWNPVNPAGNFNLSVFEKLAHGEELSLPNFGMETLHHVHADDVAQAFVAAINHRPSTLGESFHVVSNSALTLRGYAETVASWFGRKAILKFTPWEKWKMEVNKEDADATWDHISHSPNCSIAKASQAFCYQPRYTSSQAVKESIDWLIAANQLKV